MTLKSQSRNFALMPIDVGTNPPCLMAVSYSNMLRRVLSCRAMLTTCYAQLVESCQGEGGTGLETTTRSYMQHQPQKCNKQLLQTKNTYRATIATFASLPFSKTLQKQAECRKCRVVSCRVVLTTCYEESVVSRRVASRRVVSCRVDNMLLRDGRVVSCQLNTLLRRTCRVETCRGMSCRRCQRVGEVKVFFSIISN